MPTDDKRLNGVTRKTSGRSSWLMVMDVCMFGGQHVTYLVFVLTVYNMVYWKNILKVVWYIKQHFSSEKIIMEEMVTNKRYVCACRILKDVRHWWPQHAVYYSLNRWLKKRQKTSRRWICCLVPEHYRHKTRCIVFSWMALVSTITLI